MWCSWGPSRRAEAPPCPTSSDVLLTFSLSCSTWAPWALADPWMCWIFRAHVAVSSAWETFSTESHTAHFSLSDLCTNVTFWVEALESRLCPAHGRCSITLVEGMNLWAGPRRSLSSEGPSSGAPLYSLSLTDNTGHCLLTKNNNKTKLFANSVSENGTLLF